MASARTENFLPSQNSFLFNLAADWIMRDLAKGLEDPRFPKKLHEAFWWGNLRWALILAVGVTGVAVAKDYIDKNITVGAGSQPEPNSTNAGIPGSFTETMRVLDTPTPHPTETLTPTRLPTFTLTPTETPTPIATATDIPPLIPSKYALKVAKESGDGTQAMRFSILALEGKYDGPYGKYWYYTAESGSKVWIVAIFANYFDPETGIGNVCGRGSCKGLVGKEIDIIVPPDPEYFDPQGKLHNNRPYVYAGSIIEGEK